MSAESNPISLIQLRSPGIGPPDAGSMEDTANGVSETGSVADPVTGVAGPVKRVDGPGNCVSEIGSIKDTANDVSETGRVADPVKGVIDPVNGVDGPGNGASGSVGYSARGPPKINLGQTKSVGGTLSDCTMETISRPKDGDVGSSDLSTLRRDEGKRPVGVNVFLLVCTGAYPLVDATGADER